jgi:ligand-binding sensor domain-containing protein/serine phosphatase RsbU (regulator of sigma subunit)
MYRLTSLLLCLLLIACGKRDTQEPQAIRGPKVVPAVGYVVPKDSISEPVVIPIDESKLTKVPAGKPNVVAANVNVHPAGEPKIVPVGTPRVIKLGTDTFPMPKVVTAIENPFIAGMPEVVLAKDRAVKDQNPASFSSFSKLQGLKHDAVNYTLEDSYGNLWFATFSGVSKYDGRSFTHFTEKEGLINNYVYCMLEDRNGNLWFGTERGATKYDGRSFTNFSVSEGLCNDFIMTMLEDRNGNIWFGTWSGKGGACKYDGRSFTHFTEKEGLSNNNVWSILEDHSGNLWFGTWGGGVCKYDGQSFTLFTEKEGLNNNDVRCIEEDQHGNLWFGTWGAGVSKFDGQTFTYLTEKEGLCSNNFSWITEDQDGNLWFGTFGGASKYNGHSFTHFTEKEGLNSNIVSSIFEDHCGKLWFGTYGGISKYDGRVFSHFTDKEGLNSSDISSIRQDRSGNLWLNYSNAGVTKYDGRTFTHFTEKEGLLDNEVVTILEDRQGNLWFGNTRGGITKYDGRSFTHFTEKEGLDIKYVSSTIEDSNGNLWFGTSYGGGVFKYDGHSFMHYTEKEGLSNNEITSIFEDRRGNIWIATFGGGVTKYDGSTFTHFTKKEGMFSNDILIILEDRGGNLWFGSADGVIKYDGHSFTHFTEKDGLINNYVGSILEDKSGNLWFGTRFGLSMLEEAKSTMSFSTPRSNAPTEYEVLFKNYSYEDGLLGISCRSILEDESGTIWIAGNTGLTAFQAERAFTDTSAPNIQLTNLGLYNERIDWADIANKKDSTLKLGNGVEVKGYEFTGISKWYAVPENLTLAYNNNYVTFNFVGITINQPQKVNYQYILEGNDASWSAVTSTPEAHYGNLPHGTYTFKVKAMSSEGVWSEPLEYTFTIRPPWWRTWWAYTLYALLLVTGLYSYIKWRERALRTRQKDLETKVDEATGVIRRQKEEVEVKTREILDSIEYAKRIQSAILPPTRVVKEYLKNSFILYIPKDIVAGDFYWMENVDDTVFFAACDCTGHGVPGAMVSVMCNNALNRSLNEFGERLPGKIFERTRDLVAENFATSDDDVKDGMDAALCALNMKNGKLLWAGANNPIWIHRKDSNFIEEIKGDKQPIGRGYNAKPFTTHELHMNPGDTLYLFTDGYADQFGGERGKKLTKAKFREFILSIAHMPLDTQREKLLTFHNVYRGNQEQVDDICVIGVRV